MVEMVSTVTLGMLKSLEDFTNNPDVVEEYFYLMARFLQHYPQALVVIHEQHGLLGMALQYGKDFMGHGIFMRSSSSQIVFHVRPLSDSDRRP